MQLQPVAAPSLIRSILAADPSRSLCARADELLGNLEIGVSSEEFSIALGFLLQELGRKDEALHLIEPMVEQFWSNYFRLGQIGRFFQQADLNDLADKCLNRSMELRPNAFLHFDFVGDAYFGAGRFDRALAAYNAAIRLKPYLRYLLAKKFYTALSAEMRSSGTFGKPGDLRLIFQRDQDFYHDLGPAHRR
jgi:tetratricopeptide (TPR) repeat protein